MRKLATFLMGLCLLVPLPASAAPSPGSTVETRVLALINHARVKAHRPALSMHAGLRAVARVHSREMASAGRIGHTGFVHRLEIAAPSPREHNGAPDDGFHADGSFACENVAMYRPGSPVSNDVLATTFFQLWWRSAPHRRCMLQSKVNTAGLGLFRDGAGGWWATMEAAKDVSPP